MSAPSSSGRLRVLVLSKRQYMSRDLIDDRYGRFRELPLALSTLGADVRGICLSYRSRPETTFIDDSDGGHVAWTALNFRRLFAPGASGYWRALARIDAEFKPQVIWACSDTPHAILGRIAANRIRSKLVIDLYDNFESYPFARIPGANLALRRAVRSADGVTCVSAPLLRKIRDDYGFGGRIEVIENAIPAGVFIARDQATCRAELGLPSSGVFVGTAGALALERGTDRLFDAFLKLAETRPDVHLVLAGPLIADLEIPAHDRIHYLGLLPAERVPLVLSALDVSVVCNRDTSFGRYCFPQKLYESLAAGNPVAVARIGAMAELLRDFPENLYDVDDSDSLFDAIRRLCDNRSVPNIQIPTWTSLAGKLKDHLQDVAGIRSGEGTQSA